MRRPLRLLAVGRPAESLLLAGFPVFFAVLDELSDPVRLALFTAACWFESMSFLAYNAWGGSAADRLNPRLRGEPVTAGDVRPAEALALSVALLAGAIALFAAWFGASAAGCALGLAVVSILYSDPRARGKAVPVVSSVLHFSGGMLAFVLGELADGRLNTRNAAIGLFVTLAFVAGHLNHQVMDHDADAATGLRTTAVHYGARRTYDLALGVFLGAYAALGASWVTGAAPTVVAAPFLAVAVPHAALALVLVRGGPTVAARRVQRIYRALFLAAGTVALALIIADNLRGTP